MIVGASVCSAIVNIRVSSCDETLRPVKTSMKLVDAVNIADRTLALGREHSMHPLTVVVLDSGGHIVVLKREDGSGIMRADIASG